MKVVLLIDVKKLAKKGSVVEVADGYGAFLIQKKMASLATDKALQKVTHVQKQKDVQEDRQIQILLDAYEKLTGVEIRIPVRVNEKGVLYGNLHALEISQALKDTHSVSLPPGVIFLKEPLKQLGKHDVSLQAGKVKKSIEIELVPETQVKRR